MTCVREKFNRIEKHIRDALNKIYDELTPEDLQVLHVIDFYQPTDEDDDAQVITGVHELYPENKMDDDNILGMLDVFRSSGFVFITEDWEYVVGNFGKYLLALEKFKRDGQKHMILDFCLQGSYIWD